MGVHSENVGSTFVTGKETTLYKLTDEHGYTRKGKHNELLWDVGVTHTVTKPGTTLCSDEVIHAYLNPYLAVIFNPGHADFPVNSMRLFKAKGVIVAADGIQKVGVKSLEIIEELEVPKITPSLKRTIGVEALLQIPGISDETKNVIKTSEDGLNVYTALYKNAIYIVPGCCLRDIYYASYCQAGLCNVLEALTDCYGINSLDIVRKAIAAQGG
jgi:hypothetical protein